MISETQLIATIFVQSIHFCTGKAHVSPLVLHLMSKDSIKADSFVISLARPVKFYTLMEAVLPIVIRHLSRKPILEKILVRLLARLQNISTGMEVANLLAQFHLSVIKLDWLIIAHILVRPVRFSLNGIELVLISLVLLLITFNPKPMSISARFLAQMGSFIMKILVLVARLVKFSR